MTFLLSLARSLDDPRPDPPDRPPFVERLADRGAVPVSVPPVGTRLDVVDVGGVLVLSGEIDLSTRDLVTGAARQLRDRRGRYADDVVLHVSGVSFVDATGLGALVSLSEDVRADGRRLRLVGASRQLRRLSELCELTAVLGLESFSTPPLR